MTEPDGGSPSSLDRCGEPLGLSPDHLRDIRRRIRWVACVTGQRLPEEGVDDLLQDTLLRMWERGLVVSEALPAGYAVRIAENLTRDHGRRAGAAKRRPPHAPAGRGRPHLACRPPTPERVAIDREELGRRLRPCRKLLSPRAFEVFWRLFVLGERSSQVASRLGLCPSSVDSTVFRLRRSLARHGLVIRPRGSGPAPPACRSRR